MNRKEFKTQGRSAWINDLMSNLDNKFTENVNSSKFTSNIKHTLFSRDFNEMLGFLIMRLAPKLPIIAFTSFIACNIFKLIGFKFLNTLFLFLFIISFWGTIMGFLFIILTYIILKFEK